VSAATAKAMEASDAHQYLIGRLRGNLRGVFAALNAVEEAREIHRAHLVALREIQQQEAANRDADEVFVRGTAVRVADPDQPLYRSLIPHAP
jgi:small nuclear ribonucleoprotein (snRNP)-like protein